MKLIQIQYFLTIAEYKSITKAAEQLYVSQPAVTKQMNLLEEELGVRLMNRIPSGIELTETGEEFAKDLRAVMAELDRAVEKAVNAGSKKPNELRIGCFDGAFTDDFLPKLYSGLKAIQPDLRIRLGRHSVVENQKALEADRIDLMIGLKLPGDDGFFMDREYCSKTLAKREGALIYSKASPLAKKKKLNPGDFAKETFFSVSSEQSLIKPGIFTLKKMGIENPSIEEADNFASMMASVRLGLGFTVLAKQVIETDPELKAWPLPEEYGMEVVAVWKKKNIYTSRLMNKII